MFIVGFFSWVASSVFRGRANRRRENEEAALRARGVTSQATVVSAATRNSRRSVDGVQIRIDYTVDVRPEGAEPFRAQFQHWSYRRGYTAVAGEIAGEAGRLIWVTYDPADQSAMIFEYSEEERATRRSEADLEARRLDFNALAEPLERLRTSGQPADATVVEIEDLHLPYPRRESTAVRLHVDVVPAAGNVYRAVIPALIGTAAMTKYSSGRRLFVRVDADDAQRVVLDSERNRTLPN